jgi:hypothetical protein
MPSFFRAAALATGAIAALSLSPAVDTVLGSPAEQTSATVAQSASPGNAYCTAQGMWVGPPTDGPAKLPLECMYTALSGTPSPGASRGPHSTTADVQADINAAACGDKVLVAEGSTLGPLILPAKKCDDKTWIAIASTGATDPNFPTEGTRMTPCWSGVASMPNRPAYPCAKPQVLTFKIITPPSGSAIASRSGDHYRIIGAEITRVPTGGVPVYNLVDLASKRPQTSHIIFDRVWFHGINQDGNFPIRKQSDDTSTTRAIYLGQSNHIAVIDSYFSDFYDTGSMSANGNTDAQCVGGGVGNVPNSGWGVYKFVNNHCEASGEGILLGGAGGPPLTPAGCTITVNCSLDAPSDIEVRQNFFFKPLSWNGNTNKVNTVGWPVVKNGFEMKTGARALFEANVVENCWYSAQVCYSFSIAPVNQQSGGPVPVPTCPTCVIQDFTYRFNYSYNAAYGIGLYAFAPARCAACLSQGGSRISIHDNLLGDNLNLGKLSSTSAGDAMELFAADDATRQSLSQLNDISISHNTFVRAVRALAIVGSSAPGPTQMNRWVVQDNIWPHGNYGVEAFDSGRNCDTPAGNSNRLHVILQNCVTTWTWDHNAVFNWGGGNWPTNGSGRGNFFFKNPNQIKFIDYRDGDSDFKPGNYELSSSSPLHNAGSDRRDVGADIATLVAKISGVRQ